MSTTQTLVTVPAKGPLRLRAPRHTSADVLVIAGEHSGDQNAARMVAAALRRQPGLRVCALGGPKLAEAGADLLHDMTATSVIGFVDALKQLSFFKHLLNEIVRWIGEHRPKMVCFVDSSGLNLRIAERLFKAGLSSKAGGPVRTVYYISPQIWASRAKRRFKMAEHLESLAVIFPFEPECYADTTLKTEFVGHPFLEPGYVSPVRFDPAGPVLLLPGSRVKAVSRIFPMMLAGFNAFGGKEAVVIYPSEKIRATLEAIPKPSGVKLVAAGAPLGASAVLTTSGTMSMHCALAGIPGSVVYKASGLEYWIGRLIVTVPYLGIANLLLKEAMYPEYIQGAATPERLATELKECLENPRRLAVTTEQSARLKALLRQPAQGDPADWFLRQYAAASV